VLYELFWCRPAKYTCFYYSLLVLNYSSDRKKISQAQAPSIYITFWNDWSMARVQTTTHAKSARAPSYFA
jgi:hypothetical protein